MRMILEAYCFEAPLWLFDGPERNDYMYYIYCYTNIKNGMLYVGLTNNLTRRDSEHMHNYVNTYFDRAYAKHINDFKLEVILEFSECINIKDVLDVAEVFWIKKLNTKYPNGYNLTDGGKAMRGYQMPQEIREKIRLQKLGSKWGHHTEEAKKKIGDALRGELNHAYGRRGEDAIWYGKKHKESSKQKMREAHLGKNTGAANNKSRAVICIEKNLTFECIREANEWANENIRPTKITSTAISNCCRGVTKTALGLHWKYLENNNETE